MYTAEDIFEAGDPFMVSRERVASILSDHGASINDFWQDYPPVSYRYDMADVLAWLGY